MLNECWWLRNKIMYAITELIHGCKYSNCTCFVTSHWEHYNRDDNIHFGKYIYIIASEKVSDVMLCLCLGWGVGGRKGCGRALPLSRGEKEREREKEREKEIGSIAASQNPGPAAWKHFVLTFRFSPRYISLASRIILMNSRRNATEVKVCQAEVRAIGHQKKSKE